MVAARALLDALEDYLANTGGLSPSPSSVGVAEPAASVDLPAVVFSLSELTSPAPGLGERSDLVEGGALQWTSRIDLANPVLPEDLSVNLLSSDRQTLTLPHGGLVDSDGQDMPLAADDLQVDRDGVPFTVVAAGPAGGEVAATPANGRLEFGAPLPATGLVTATYFIGQWERRVERLAGTLDVGVAGVTVDDARNLSNGVLDALKQAPGGIAGLGTLALTSVGTVSAFTIGTTIARLRRLRWRFDYEHIVDRPESSGGIIQRIQLKSRPDDAPFEEEDIA